MKKELDCKVIEDLMLPYLDGTLNLETKEIMDKHFSECEECRKKLDEMKSSVLENDENDKKCIDFLKKARRKERFRVVKFILLIALIVFLIVYLRNFVILNGIYSSREKYLLSDNLYIQRVDHQPNNVAMVTKYYYKDGKSKIVYDTYNNDGFLDTYTVYSDMDSNDLKNIVEDFILPYNLGIFEKLYYSLGFSVFTTFHSDTLHTHFSKDDRECYLLTDDKNNRTWYDKKTGLKVKQIVPNAQDEYYENSTILKSIQDQVTDFEFEFGVVTDEDVTNPVISNN